MIRHRRPIGLQIWNGRAAVAGLTGLVLAFVLASASPALGEILIERGDTVSVTIAEAPKLSGERKVDGEGRITLPQLGGVPVAGIGLEAARQRLEQALVDRDILKVPTVVVEIAKYRPFYIGGKVARPGAIDYEPGLTVRHAIILAGGVGKAQEDTASAANIPDLRAKWQTSSYQLLQVNSRIARLQAELTRNEADKPGVARGAIAPSDAEALLSLDESILKDRLDGWTGDQMRLKDEIALFDLEIDVLGQQADLQENQQKIAKDQVEAARALVEKGLMPLPRLQELQHMQSQAQLDILENRAFSARARQSRTSAQYELESADIKWRIDIRQQLRDAMVDRARIKAELEAISTQILDAGASLSDADALQLQTVIVIYRTVNGREESIEAQMNTEVQPGDIVDVSFTKGAG